MVIIKVAITQLAMELQLWKFTIQYIQKIGEQHIRQKSSIFNSFWVISDFYNLPPSRRERREIIKRKIDSEVLFSVKM